jgi:hypothetical protein
LLRFTTWAGGKKEFRKRRVVMASMGGLTARGIMALVPLRAEGYTAVPAATDAVDLDLPRAEATDQKARKRLYRTFWLRESNSGNSSLVEPPGESDRR